MNQFSCRCSAHGILLAMSLAVVACAYAAGDEWVYDSSQHPADDVDVERSLPVSLEASIAAVPSAVEEVDHGILTRLLSNGRRVKFGTAPGFLLFFR